MKHDAHVRTAFNHFFPFKFLIFIMFSFFLFGFTVSAIYHSFFYTDILLNHTKFK